VGLVTHCARRSSCPYRLDCRCGWRHVIGPVFLRPARSATRWTEGNGALADLSEAVVTLCPGRSRMFPSKKSHRWFVRTIYSGRSEFSCCVKFAQCNGRLHRACSVAGRRKPAQIDCTQFQLKWKCAGYTLLPSRCEQIGSYAHRAAPVVHLCLNAGGRPADRGATAQATIGQ